MAINRILVDESLYEAFVERFSKRAAVLECAEDGAIGPIINQQQVERIEKLIDGTLKAGARATVRGKRDRLLLSPTVLAGVTNDMPAAREEIFGPVAPILKVHGDDEAVRVANDTEEGLSSAVFSRDLERALRVAERLQAGMTHVNDAPVNDEPNTAFGGEKASGLGRFGGLWAIGEFTTDHWISLQRQPRKYPF